MNRKSKIYTVIIRLVFLTMTWSDLPMRVYEGELIRCLSEGFQLLKTLYLMFYKGLAERNWTKPRESFYSINYVNENVNYSVKYSTVDCKYLLFLQEFFFRLKPKKYKKCQYKRLFKKHLETHKTKQII